MIIQKVTSDVWQEYVNNRVSWYKNGNITDALGFVHKADKVSPLEADRELVGAYGTYIFGTKTPCVAVSIPLETSEFIVGEVSSLEFFEKLHLGALNITTRGRRSVHWVSLDSRCASTVELYNIFTTCWGSRGGEVFTEGGHVHLAREDSKYRLNKVYGRRAPFSLQEVFETDNMEDRNKDTIGVLLYDEKDSMTTVEFKYDLTGVKLPKWDIVHSRDGGLSVVLS